MARAYAHIASKVGVHLRHVFGLIDKSGRVKDEALPIRLASLLRALEERDRLP
jgi:hypothetical protein